jgi:hypothetical protein
MQTSELQAEILLLQEQVYPLPVLGEVLQDLQQGVQLPVQEVLADLAVADLGELPQEVDLEVEQGHLDKVTTEALELVARLEMLLAVVVAVLERLVEQVLEMVVMVFSPQSLERLYSMLAVAEVVAGETPMLLVD